MMTASFGFGVSVTLNRLFLEKARVYKTMFKIFAEKEQLFGGSNPGECESACAPVLSYDLSCLSQSNNVM